MKNKIRNTSTVAFHSLTDLSRRQSEVYRAISAGTKSNLDIAEFLHMPINSITPRTNELVEKGAVQESHRAVSPITGKRVIYWKIKLNEPKQESLYG